MMKIFVGHRHTIGFSTTALWLSLFLSLNPLTLQSATAEPLEAPEAIRQGLLSGEPQDLIVLFDETDAEVEAATIRRERRLPHDDAALLRLKARRYGEIRAAVLNRLPAGHFTIRKSFSQLPMAFIRLTSSEALATLLADPAVTAIYENKRLYRQLSQSLPLIKQIQAASIGLTGAGVSVAVIDTGINFGLAVFGSCTAPGVPAGCRVVAAVDIAPDDGALDDNNHGSNVAAIVAGTASSIRMVALDVFDGDSATFADVIDAINWAIEHKTDHAIVALNMSLGDGDRYTSPCSSKATNPFVTPIANARAAGIVPVAAAGNEAYTNGISLPGCTPGVVAVGAVYDANVGARSWGVCSDTTTAADKVACFSNSASFLTMLAPGAPISAAGYIMDGTSQAAPHVAGAAAALRAAYPAESLTQIVGRMTSTGVAVTDPRNGIVTPRLNLLAAAGPPANDAFSAAGTLQGDSGTLTATSYNATREDGEPAHAGNSGGASVWWHWTVPFSGIAGLDTHGSGFDTLLAVYTGSQPAQLASVAANNNDGSGGGTSGLTFTARSGTLYRIAVDGLNGAAGVVNLSWNLAAEADLTLEIAVTPAAVLVGDSTTVSLTTDNLGPSTATASSASLLLPEGLALVSASPGCSLAGSLVTCDLGSLNPGATAQATLMLRPTTSGVLTFSGQAASGTTDPIPGNNSGTGSVTAQEPPPAVPALSSWSIIALIALLGAGFRRTT